VAACVLRLPHCACLPHDFAFQIISECSGCGCGKDAGFRQQEAGDGRLERVKEHVQPCYIGRHAYFKSRWLSSRAERGTGESASYTLRTFFKMPS